VERRFEAVGAGDRELSEVHGLFLGLVVSGFALLLDGFESDGRLFGGALDALRVEGEALETGGFVAPGLGLRGHGVEVFVVVLFEDVLEEGGFELVSAFQAPVRFGDGADEVRFGLVGGGVALR